MVKDIHSCECQNNSGNISNITCIEVRNSEVREGFGFALEQHLIDIKFKAQPDKNAWNNNISQSKHTKLLLSLIIQVRKQQLNRNIKIPSNRNHHISAIHPENIIEEQQPQQNKPYLEIRQVNIPQSHNRKQNPIDIIEDPVLGEVESHHWNGANDTGDYACRGNIEIIDFE